MRFGLDGTPLANQRTGVGHYTFELARALAAVAPAHEFEVVSPSSFFASQDTGNYRLPNLRFTDAGVNGWKRRGWWSVLLPRYCNQASFNLFHGTNFELPYWTRCPTVVTIHDLSLLLYPETHEKRRVRRARVKLPFMARKATAIITPSEAVKSEVCLHLNVRADKVFVVPDAARRCFYRVSGSESRPICERLGIKAEFILFVGTIEPRKNILSLVRAFEEVNRSSSSDLQLVIAGKEGWLSGGLMAYLRDSQIKDHVLFTGHVSDDALRALYSACRVFVYPSLYEGFGLPLLEAMACGAPVVAGNVPGIVETVGDAARLVSPRDSLELAKAIKGLLKDTDERENRRAAGIQHAKKFSWERTASATLEIYERAIGQRPPKKVYGRTRSQE